MADEIQRHRPMGQECGPQWYPSEIQLPAALFPPEVVQQILRGKLFRRTRGFINGPESSLVQILEPREVAITQLLVEGLGLTDYEGPTSGEFDDFPVGSLYRWAREHNIADDISLSKLSNVRKAGASKVAKTCDVQQAWEAKGAIRGFRIPKPADSFLLKF